MKNFIKLFGSVSVLTAICLSIASCGDKPYVWKLINQSSYEVKISNSDFDPSEFTLAPGENRLFTIPKEVPGPFTYSPASKLNITRYYSGSGGVSIFTDK